MTGPSDGMTIILSDTSHTDALLRYHLDNALRFKRWMPAPPPVFFTHDFWQRRLQERERKHLEGTARHFIGLDPATGSIVGTCSLTNILYEPAWYCFMGYSVDGRFEGTGTMTRIVNHAIGHAFADLGLNRIVASYMPENTRSKRLLVKLGFEREGFSRRLLRINGQWADHVNMALLNPAPPSERNT